MSTGGVRVQVLFVMHVATRRVTIAGIRRDPSESWLLQLGRNLTDAIDGFLLGMRYLILDRDPLYTRRFRDLLASSGVKVVRLPRESPNLNAHAERWVRSIRGELLDRLVIVGEEHLRRVVLSYVEHYNAERPHQGLDGELIEPDPRATNGSGRVVRRDRCGRTRQPDHAAPLALARGAAVAVLLDRSPGHALHGAQQPPQLVKSYLGGRMRQHGGGWRRGGVAVGVFGGGRNRH